MPNQLNYPDRLPDTLNNIRPSRLSTVEEQLIKDRDGQNLFGTSERDVVEIWIYYPDGRFAGNIELRADDPALKLSTVLDNTNAYEFLNIDFGEIIRRLNIEQGRYAIVVNMLRNEVGSSSGNKLYIDTISTSRTEIRLKSVDTESGTFIRDIYEFVTPSVPKISAQALIEQLAGKNLDILPGEQLRPQSILSDANIFITDTADRINYAGAIVSYEELVNFVIEQAHLLAIDLMAADKFNVNIQQTDIENYVSDAVQQVIYNLRRSGIIDNRFEVF